VLHAWKDVTYGHALHTRFPLERSDEVALSRRESHPQSLIRNVAILWKAKLHRQVLRRRNTRRTIRRLQIRRMTCDGERHRYCRDGYGEISHHQRTGQSTEAHT
jgi:hypothetical protein